MRYDLIVLLILLLCIALSDYRTTVIPDGYILAGIAFRTVYLIFLNSYINILKSLGSALLIFVPLLLGTVVYEKKTGKQGAGGGDLKTLGLVAFYLSPMETLVTLLVASLLQITAFKYTMKQVLPFGRGYWIIPAFFKVLGYK
ncbi:MAG: prepilin peptidase [Erysipelotrichaceae bacterium]|nr:prepilin peptidase [Erysipelotrichaceae bacterium]